MSLFKEKHVDVDRRCELGKSRGARSSGEQVISD